MPGQTRRQDLIGFCPQIFADQWLGVEALISYERPVPLIEGVIDRSGNFRHSELSGKAKSIPMVPSHNIVMRRDKPSLQDIIVPLTRHLISDPKEKIIIFRNTRGSAEGCARYLSAELGLVPATEIVAQLPNHDISSTSVNLRECLNGGVAFHNTNLNRLEKSVIEKAFRDPNGKIRVLVATSTLAAGINTPASTVIIAEQEFIGEVTRPFTVAEYKNMAGRAGRWGFNEEGKSILLAENDYDTQPLFNRYVLGKPEQITSSFDPKDVETWIIRLLAQISKVPRTDIIQLLANTYGGYLANRQNPSWRDTMKQHLEQLLSRMLSLGLLEQEADLVQLTLLGRACGQSSLSLQSTMRLVEVLRSSGIVNITAEHLMAIVQVLPESDAIYTPLFKRGQREADMAGRASSRYGHEVVRILQRHAQDNFSYYARCKRAAVLHDWINGVPTDAIEKDYTTNPYQGKIGYGDIRGFADTTRFHLRSAIPIANLILMDKAPAGQSLETLLKQLEVGIPAGALELLTIPMAFERGECLVLYNASIKTTKTFWAASAEMIANLLGKTRLAEIEKIRLKEKLQA